MRKEERKPDRGRPPPRIRWRELVRLDASGRAIVAMFLVTLLVLAILIALAKYTVHSY
jgi:hypothetical protein